MADQVREDDASQRAHDAFVARNFRYNFVLMLLDAITFPFGISLISAVTILPLFVREMTSSQLAIGLLPAIVSIGMLLPPVFVTNIIERRPMAKWVVFWVAMLERAPLLLLAILIPWLGRVNPPLLLIVFYVAFAFHNACLGVGLPAYFNLYAKIIPPNRRGRMWGIGGAIGGLLALGGAWISGVVLERYGFPDAFAFSFMFSFVVLTIGIIGFTRIRELPSMHIPERAGMLSVLRGIPRLLRTDTQFGYFIATQVVYSFSLMAPAFYTVYAIDELGATPRQVALFTSVLMGGNALANPMLGFLADRRGYKLVFQIAMFLGVAAPLLTLYAPSVGWMYGVFALNSVVLVGTNLGSMNLPLEFAPRSQVATYSAVSMTTSAPFRSVAPIVGGVLAAYSYVPVFVIPAAASLIALALLSTRVLDPRFAISRPPAAAVALAAD